MKTRYGFVSNSSSSSFIIALDKIPKSKEDVNKIFYKGCEKSFEDCVEDPINTDILSKRLWNDIKKQKPIKSVKTIAKIIKSGYFIDCLEPELDDFTIKSKKSFDWKKYQILRDHCAESIADVFLKINKKRFIYILHYEDSNKLEGHLEHGDTFYNVKHLRISHH